MKNMFFQKGNEKLRAVIDLSVRNPNIKNVTLDWNSDGTTNRNPRFEYMTENKCEHFPYLIDNKQTGYFTRICLKCNKEIELGENK